MVEQEKDKKEDKPKPIVEITEKKETPNVEEAKKKKVVKEDNATKAKRLSKSGLTTKQVGAALGLSKYDASKLIKG